MTSLFNRVKERVRSRSRHRKSSSWYGSNFRPSTSGDDVPPVPPLPYDDEDDGAAPAPFIPRVSMDNSAFLITARHGKPVGTYDIITRNSKPVEKRYSARSSAPRISEEQRGREVVALRDMMEFRKDNPDDQSVLQTLMGTMVPDRASSRKARSLTAKSTTGHRRHVSQPVPQSDQQPISSERKSTDTQKSGRPKSGHARYASQPFPESPRTSMPSIASRGKEPPPVPPIPQFNRDRMSAAIDTRTDDRQFAIRAARTSMEKQTNGVAMTNGNIENVRASEPRQSYDGKAKKMTNGTTPRDPNLRLPQGFSLDNSEVTEVAEHVRPAVTQENIIKHRTEIIHEEVTRDIHVHHYYTYLQPIKVVEILAPKHYRIDQRTGKKIEIPAPAGWVMPQSMRPTQHDYTMVKGWTRHYLVNEQHPDGVLEAAPASDESAVDRDSTPRASKQFAS